MGTHYSATLVLVVREVPAQGLSPDKLANYERSAYISSTSFWWGDQLPGSAWPEEFPRRQGFQANPGMVWGKPLPEAAGILSNKI